MASLLSENPVWPTLVFVLAGILGGMVGYLMNNASVKWKRKEFLKSLFFGILVSGGIISLLALLYSELFIVNSESLLNLVLAGCICFMFSMVALLFAYRFLMRLSARKSLDVRADAES
ncbi:hypothetical protein HUK80_07680 [Flavobacterium sp. MAH-1]|uniref:YEATS-Like-Associating Three TM domain-containing protein n=1 Tax=Flavobacterium agri TaxID=2743471 RepID=A0A7Y8Y1L4_9FLAO|nr:YEATS-associated helix-containing protein [Flavobacterium agri]NUY80767.1 hypothetical protein [Flavobacterium agri]NYA70791.1 hypothetical protein [Flavobacterium agri]